MKTLIVALMLFLPSMAFAQDKVLVQKGYVKTGNYVYAFSKTEREIYLAGIIDGVFLSSVFETEEDKRAWIVGCMLNKDTTELKEIVDEYLKTYTGSHDDPMNAVLYESVLKKCNRT